MILSWCRYLLGKLSSRVPGYSIETRLEFDFPPRQYGDRSPDGQRVYLEGGPPNDPNKNWDGEFPPRGYVEPKATVGSICTLIEGQLLKRAKIVEASAQQVLVKVEYDDHLQAFTRRANGHWRSEGQRGSHVRRLVIGIGVTNLKRYKKWYSSEDMERGWILD